MPAVNLSTPVYTQIILTPNAINCTGLAFLSQVGSDYSRPPDFLSGTQFHGSLLSYPSLCILDDPVERYENGDLAN